MKLHHPFVEGFLETIRRTRLGIFGENDFYEGFFQNIIKGVECDIRELEEYFTMPKFEREKDDHFFYLIDKYMENYFPFPSMYRNFSLKDRFIYEGYRGRIDELLESNSQNHSDDVLCSKE